MIYHPTLPKLTPHSSSAKSPSLLLPSVPAILNPERRRGIKTHFNKASRKDQCMQTSHFKPNAKTLVNSGCQTSMIMMEVLKNHRENMSFTNSKATSPSKTHRCQ